MVGETEANSKAELEAATETLGFSEAAFSDLTVKLADEKARRSQLTRSLEEAKLRKEKITSQLLDVQNELSSVTETISGLDGPIAKQEEVNRLENLSATLEQAFTDAEQITQRARETEQALRSPLEEAEGNVREIETEARTLRQILNRSGQELFPAVVERISVETGYEAALGAALGEDLDVSINSSAPVHWGIAGDGSEDLKLPDGVKPLSSLVKAPMELSRRLAQIGIVEKSQAPNLAKLLKPGQRIVTQEGDLWRWDGFVASAEAPTAAALRLAQKNRLAELDAMALEARQTLTSAEQAYDVGKEKTAAAIELELQTREKVRNHQKALADAREALSIAERSVSQLSAKRSALEEAQTRLLSDQEETDKRVVETDSALISMVDMSASEAELESLRTDVAQNRARLAEARAASQSLSSEAEARGRRLEVIQIERNNWQSRLKNALQQIERLTKRRDEVTVEIAKLADAPSEYGAKRNDLIRQLEVAEQARKEAADTLELAEKERADADRLARQAVNDLAEAREKTGRAEERLNAAKERRAEIEARIHDELECAPSQAMQIAELKPDDQLPEIEKTENKLERQKAERERLGAVNLRAEVEQQEIDEKRTEIVTERDDLIEAIAKLRSGIQSLNKEGRERLLEAFEVVNTQFKRLFTHLFGGGTAELQLVESDDPLEAGLEIMARPPGKKPQTMTLLSGGEQALTAMALIFAVFLTNPAPICVLDEVDAPLDDHNVERFCNLMDEMSSTTDTKFVLITHNPITMARMDRMFGVTMAERGVSQIVSVDLEEAEKLRETA